jgi:hypothetical protein
LERFAIPIAIGIAVVVVVAIPSLRHALVECFRAGQRHGKKLSGKEEPEQGADEGLER